MCRARVAGQRNLDVFPQWPASCLPLEFASQKVTPMEILGMRAAAHKARRALGAIAGTLILFGAHTAVAQTNPAGSASDQAPSEAARRAAASPYRFILQNASAPARKPAAAPSKPAESTAVAAPEPKRSAAPAVQQATAQP